MLREVKDWRKGFVGYQSECCLAFLLVPHFLLTLHVTEIKNRGIDVKSDPVTDRNDRVADINRFGVNGVFVMPRVYW